MVYKPQYWNDYDETKTETQNIELGAVVTSERMNTIENGIHSNDLKSDDLQRQIENTQSGLVGGYNSEAELKKAYPKGTKGYAIVWLNENNQKVGYTYTYKNNAWTKGNVWNGIGIPNKSIASDKLADDAVDSLKRTVKGDKVSIITPPYATLPNVDVENKTLTFYNDTLFTFPKRNSKYSNAVLLKADRVINLNEIDSSTKVVVLDVESEQFSVGPYGYNPTETEVVVTVGRLNGRWTIFDLGIPYLVDFENPSIRENAISTEKIKDAAVVSKKRTVKGDKASIITPNNGKMPNIDIETKTLTLFNDTIIYYKKKNSENEFYYLLSKDIHINLDEKESSTKVVAFDIETKTFRTLPYNLDITENEIVIASGRFNGASTFLDLGIPYTINGKYYWEILTPRVNIGNNSGAILNVFSDRIISGHHRGQQLDGPENTLSAYKLSKKQGTSIVEMDLAFTKDDVPVCLHDSTINRTARNKDGSKILEETKISDLTFDEVRQYDFGIWKDEKYKGEKMPSFEEIIRLVSSLEMHLYIDKGYFFESKVKAKKVIDIIKKYNWLDNVSFMTSRAGANNVIEQYSKARFLIVDFNITDEMIDEALRLKALGNEVSLMGSSLNVSDNQITSALNKELSVELWNCYEDTDYKKFIDLGVTGFQTDGYNFKELMISKL